MNLTKIILILNDLLHNKLFIFQKWGGNNVRKETFSDLSFVSLQPQNGNLYTALAENKLNIRLSIQNVPGHFVAIPSESLSIFLMDKKANGVW